MIGGIAMAISCGVEFVKHSTNQSAADLLLYLLVIAYAATSAFLGASLWKDRTSSYLPSALIWSAQVPVIVSAPLSYAFCTGFGIVIQQVSTSATTGIKIDFALLERHVLYITGQPEAFVIGVNIFAIYCSYALLRQRKSILRTNQVMT